MHRPVDSNPFADARDREKVQAMGKCSCTCACGCQCATGDEAANAGGNVASDQSATSLQNLYEQQG